MTLLHCILILLTPFFGFLIVKIWKTLKQEFLKKGVFIFLIVCLIIFLTPLSFAGERADFLVLIFCLSVLFAWKFKSKGLTISGLLKSTGLLLLVFVFLFFEAVAAQFTGVTDILSYLIIEKTTTDKNYKLIHRKVNTNFMYSGTHLITIKERMKVLPFLEWEVGRVDAGQFFDNSIPSQFEYLVDRKNKRLIIKSGSDTSIAY